MYAIGNDEIPKCERSCQNANFEPGGHTKFRRLNGCQGIARYYQMSSLFPTRVGQAWCHRTIDQGEGLVCGTCTGIKKRANEGAEAIENRPLTMVQH